jgi:protein-L-isoaspartate(D-aspartate) O-methyltransferase
MDYAAARSTMVASQVRPNDVTDRRIQEAMNRIPRERFVLKGKQDVAYADNNLDMGGGRVLMEPRCFAKLLQAAGIREDDLVLEVACGTGYSTAVLAALAGAVVALESDKVLAEMATSALTEIGVDNAAVVIGLLTEGYPQQGLYDVIFINGGIEIVPQSLFDQLKAGGRLAAVLAEDGGHARIYTKTQEEDRAVISSRMVFDAFVPVLPGFEMQEEFTF